MFKTVSTLVVIILVAGLFLRNRRRIHIPLMVTAFTLDLGLVLAIELNRGAVKKATSGPSPLLLFHVLMSVVALASYTAMAALGNGVRRGAEHWRPWHRRIGWIFGVSRTANYITSWMI